MPNTQLTKKKNWRHGLATAFTVAAITATLTNYAVWEEDVLIDYTYTNDRVAIGNFLFLGSANSSTTDTSATLIDESIFSIYSGLAEMDFIDSTNPNQPSWSIGQVSNNADFNVSWRGDMDSTDGAAVVTQNVMTFEDNSPTNSIETFASGDVSLANGDVYWSDSSSHLGVGTTISDFTALTLKSEQSGITYESLINGGSTWFSYISGVDDPDFSGFNLGKRSPIFTNQVMRIDNNADSFSLVMDQIGAGFGTNTPSASLEVERSDGTAKILVDEQAPTPQKRRLLELSNNGAASLLFTDTSNNVQWELNPNSTGNFIINSVNLGPVGSAAEMSINRLNGLVNFRGDVNGKSFNATSSRETKEEFKPVDNAEILDKVVNLEITNWKFKTDAADAPRHIGPMAEEFEEVFQLGTDGKTIGMTDVNGIALASIQALDHRDESLQKQIQEKNERIAELEQRLIKLESLIMK